MMRSTLVILFLMACGGKSQPAATVSAPTCKAVARHLADESTMRDKDAFANGLLSRCQTDHWSDEARSCLLQRGEAGPCTLSEPQRAGIEQERARQLENEATKQDG